MKKRPKNVKGSPHICLIKAIWNPKCYSTMLHNKFFHIFIITQFDEIFSPSIPNKMEKRYMKFHIWQLMSLADKLNHKNHIATFLSIYFSTILHNIYHKFWNIILIINNGGKIWIHTLNWMDPSFLDPWMSAKFFIQRAFYW